MEPSEEERALFQRLTGIKERLWRELQDCYNLTKNLPQKFPQFKVRVEQIYEVKIKFDEILDDLDLLSNKYKEFKMDVVELTSCFDALYYEILACSGEYQTPVAQTPSSDFIHQSQKRELSLRDIQLPKFDGRPENFAAFRSMFDALVHNVDYSKIEKFTILMNHLEGSALKFAQTIRFSPENYLVAYNQLVQRYTNKRIIANHYLKTIFNLTPLKKDSRVTISELCETLQMNVSALRDMRLTDLSDFVFLQFSLRLLDDQLKEEFEEKHLGSEFPTFKNLIDFLRNKCSVSQLVGTGLDFKPTKSNVQSNVPVLKYSEKRIAMTTQELPNENNPNALTNMKFKSFNGRCACCNDDSHFKLTKCEKFNSWTPKTRHDFIKEKGFCYACFYPHNISNCRVKIVCKYCSSKRHNTLLHENNYPSTRISDSSPNEFKALFHSCDFENRTGALLATAKTLIKDTSGKLHPCRLVLDSGSQFNFITAAMTHLLGLPRKRCTYEISGIRQNKSTSIQGEVQCEIISLYNQNFAYNFDAVVLQKITSNLPVVSLPNEIKDRFNDFQLADPDFNITSSIDVLLGVQALLDVTPTEPHILKGKPSAYLTELGWIVLGNMQSTIPSITSLMGNVSTYQEPSLNEILRAFWEVEEVKMPILPSVEDRNCEQNYLATVKRNKMGQYFVRLLFNVENPELTDNRNLVLNRFHKLEARFERDTQFCELYCNAMKDYIDQGHLIPAKTDSSYLLTHHGVLKHDSKGSNLRVVFNPAEKDKEGRSLNQYLFSGPKLHQDISCIITRFRLSPIGLTCDIKQMFRCIILDEEDRKYFHIFWRFSADDPLVEYEHTRVIFGATSSPYLAIRTFLKLVEDEGRRYLLAARALTEQTFVDDILTGTETPQQAKELKEQLINLLRSGGFELGKWACSDSEVLRDEELVELPLGEIPSTVKVLGLRWNVKTDMFQYKIQHTIEEPPTKRGILSRVARTFDINGYLSPFTFLLKSLIQQLWLLKIDWDDELPPNILEKWVKVKRELHILEDIKIPRNIYRNGASASMLIGFSDASELGMAAVVYLRQKFQNSVSIRLVAGKSKVRPLKTWTIPKLELGAACLLSKLMKTTLESLTGYVQLAEPIASWIQPLPWVG